MSKEKNLPPLDPLASAEPVAAQRTTLGKSLDKTDAVYGITAARCCCATQSSKEGQERLGNNLEISANESGVSVVLNGTKVSVAQIDLLEGGYIGCHTTPIEFSFAQSR